MRDRKAAFQFFAVSFLLNMAANYAHPVTPTIIKNRGFGDYVFGAALASMMAANFLASPFWGKAITTISSRKTLLITCFGYAVGQVMFGLAKTEAAVFVARVFAGIFIAGLFTACLTYVVNTASPDSTGSYLTAYATLQLVASSFGFFVGGMLGEIHESVAIVTQAITLAFCGALFYFVCENDASSASDFRAFAKEANPFAAFVAAKGLMTPLYIALFTVCAISNFGSVAFDQSFNYYMKAQLGFSSGYNGTIKAVTGLVALLTNGTIGLWLVNKTDIRRSLIYVYGLCTLSVAAIVSVDSLVPFGAFAVMYFGLWAVAVPLTQSLVASKAYGKDSNLVMGCFNGLKSLGGIFGSLLAGLLYTANPKFPFLLGLVAFALTTFVSVSYLRISTEDAGARSQSRF